MIEFEFLFACFCATRFRNDLLVGLSGNSNFPIGRISIPISPVTVLAGCTRFIPSNAGFMKTHKESLGKPKANPPKERRLSPLDLVINPSTDLQELPSLSPSTYIKAFDLQKLLPSLR